MASDHMEFPDSPGVAEGVKSSCLKESGLCYLSAVTEGTSLNVRVLGLCNEGNNAYKIM